MAEIGMSVVFQDAFRTIIEGLSALKNDLNDTIVNDCETLCLSYNLCQEANLAGTRLIKEHNIKPPLLEKIQNEIIKERCLLLKKQKELEVICETAAKNRKKIDELLKTTIAKCGVEPLLLKTEYKISAIEMVEVFQDFERKIVNECVCREFLLQGAVENVADSSFDKMWRRKHLMFIDDILQVGSHLVKNFS